jgi:hypothetical protein
MQAGNYSGAASIQAPGVLEPISQIGKGCVAEDLSLMRGARKEQIRTDLGLTSNEAAGSKIGNPSGWSLLGGWQRCSSVTERPAMLPRRAWPAAQQAPAHPFPIYEMGSSLSPARRGRRGLNSKTSQPERVTRKRPSAMNSRPGTPRCPHRAATGCGPPAQLPLPFGPRQFQYDPLRLAPSSGRSS